MKNGLKSLGGASPSHHEISIFCNTEIFWDNNIVITFFRQRNYASLKKISPASTKDHSHLRTHTFTLTLTTWLASYLAICFVLFLQIISCLYFCQPMYSTAYLQKKIDRTSFEGKGSRKRVCQKLERETSLHLFSNLWRANV